MKAQFGMSALHKKVPEMRPDGLKESCAIWLNYVGIVSEAYGSCLVYL